MGSKERNREKEMQRRYLDGLKRYKARGVRVLIDGRELPEDEWSKIFRLAESGAREDGAEGFYMADFIAAPYGEICEIRLERVYVKAFET